MAESDLGRKPLEELLKKKLGEKSNFLSPGGLSGQGRGPAGTDGRRRGEERARELEGEGQARSGEGGGGGTKTTEKADFFPSETEGEISDKGSVKKFLRVASDKS